MQFIKCRLESSKTCHLVLEKCVTSLLINPFKVNVPSHTETSQLICQAITFTGFYMMGEQDIDEFKNMLKKVTMQHRKTNIVGNKAKRRISKQVFQENKASQIFRKTNISYPPDMHIYVSGGKKCSFFRKFGVLFFVETSVLRFALLTYYWWYFVHHSSSKKIT